MPTEGEAVTLTDSETDQVENRYRTALSRQLPTLEWRAHQVGRVLDEVQAAMRQGAWSSSSHVADDFLAGCEVHERSAVSAADECAAEFRSRRDRQPTTVESTDRRAHWG